MTVTMCAVGTVVFVLSYCFTNHLCSSDIQGKLLDHPNERSLHRRPTPRTGGLAIGGSFLVGVILWSILSFFQWWPVGSPGFSGETTEVWIILMMVFIGGVSFWDDRAGFPVWTRFGAHLLGAVGVVMGGGIMVNHLSLPGFGQVELGWTSMIVSIGLLMWMTNLYNFMDGMDGLAGGMTVIGFGILAVLAWEGGHQPLMIIALFICAATVGFLLFNFPPAKIFMGDVGSVSLGFLAGALTLLGARDGLYDVWVPVLVFSPFIVDATVTLLKRLAKREPVWKAHRQHYYQQLVLAGWGHKQTVLAEYVLMQCCGASALVYVRVQESLQLGILLGWVVIYLLLLLLIRGVVHPATLVKASR